VGNFIKENMNKILLLFIFIFGVQSVFAVPLEELVTPANIERLRSGVVMETQLRNPSPVLLPLNDDEFRRFVNAAKDTLNPGMLVEALYLYNKPEQAGQSASWTEAQRSGLFNQLLALSTMAGIQYFSASRGTMRTFFETSRVVDGPGSKTPLPDPVYTEPPSALTLYARQKDLSFGDNIYRYDYFTRSDSIYFTQDNMTQLFYGIIPVIGRGNLRSIVIVYDCGDSLLIYFNSMVKTLSVPGLGDRISASFSNRAEAILKWFTGRADIVFSTNN
jgi:hypothetical protein